MSRKLESSGARPSVKIVYGYAGEGGRPGPEYVSS